MFRRVLSASLLMTTVLVTVLSASIPSWAHSDLLNSSPSQGSVSAEVSSVTLTFVDEIVPEYTALALTRGDGSRVELDEPSTDATNRIVSVAPRDGMLSDDSYVLGYYIVSIDGHPIEGSVSFEVAGAPTPAVSETPAPGASAAPTEEATAVPFAAEARTADSGVSTGVEWVWIGTGIATVVVLGAVSAVLLVALRRRRDANN
jgi:methionine-rich copper-binding protein CopC